VTDDDQAQIAQFVAAAVGSARDAAARRAVFVAVRDLPYATNAAADAIALIHLRRGNCLAKADLLARGLRLLGADARRVRWRYQLPGRPPEVGLLPTRDDMHTAIEVDIAGHWALVDATHDPPPARGGFVINDWDGAHPTRPAYEPHGPIWREGPDDAAIAAAIAAITARYQGRAAAPAANAGATYLHAFNTWLEQLRAGTSGSGHPVAPHGESASGPD